MTETPSSPELNPEWQEAIRQGIQDSIENYEIFGQINASPITLTDGMDEREFAGLSRAEKRFVERELFQAVGFDPHKAKQVAAYAFEAPLPSQQSSGFTRKEIDLLVATTEYDPAPSPAWQRTAIVRVYETDRAEEDMYVHRIAYNSRYSEHMVAPKDYRM